MSKTPLGYTSSEQDELSTDLGHRCFRFCVDFERVMNNYEEICDEDNYQYHKRRSSSNDDMEKYTDQTSLLLFHSSIHLLKFQRSSSGPSLPNSLFRIPSASSIRDQRSDVRPRRKTLGGEPIASSPHFRQNSIGISVKKRNNI